MFGLIITIIISISAVLVYIDATNHNIGKIPGQKGFFNMSAGAWASVTLLLWIAGFPLYLIKRNSLIAAAQEAPVHATGRLWKVTLLAVAGLFFVLFYNADFLFQPSGNAQNNVSETAESTVDTPFNTSDKMVTVNGNIAIAVGKINKLRQASVWDKSVSVSIEKITTSPYDYLGKMIRVTGELYKIEQLPPDQYPGQWSELLLLAQNPNSPMGSITIDYIYQGDISKIRSGQKITCAGYYAGTFETKNAMGGDIEAVVFVGNDVR